MPQSGMKVPLAEAIADPSKVIAHQVRVPLQQESPARINNVPLAGIPVLNPSEGK